ERKEVLYDDRRQIVGLRFLRLHAWIGRGVCHGECASGSFGSGAGAGAARRGQTENDSTRPAEQDGLGALRCAKKASRWGKAADLAKHAGLVGTLDEDTHGGSEFRSGPASRRPADGE